MEATKVVTVKAMEATPLTFKDYGQVVEASPDGDEFGPHDAQLDLTHGTPRFHLSFNLQFLGLFSPSLCFLPLVNSTRIIIELNFNAIQ